MSHIVLKIPGQPVAKGRARSVVRNGHIRHYTPEKTAKYECLVKSVGQLAMKGLKPIDGPIHLTVTAFMAIPPSWSKIRQSEATSGDIFPISRPDLDNIIKSIKDGLNGVAWKDDSQVVSLKANKIFASDPYVFVSIEEINAS